MYVRVRPSVYVCILGCVIMCHQYGVNISAGDYQPLELTNNKACLVCVYLTNIYLWIKYYYTKQIQMV